MGRRRPRGGVSLFFGNKGKKKFGNRIKREERGKALISRSDVSGIGMFCSICNASLQRRHEFTCNPHIHCSHVYMFLYMFIHVFPTHLPKTDALHPDISSMRSHILIAVTSRPQNSQKRITKTKITSSTG